MQLLGYANHASYVLETRMAKNAEAVQQFLAHLEGKLKPRARAGKPFCCCHEYRMLYSVPILVVRM